jgi:dTDP-4-amino-4,6-dideoxygalactose transaminase
VPFVDSHVEKSGEVIPVLDLQGQYPAIGEEIEAAALEVLRNGAYILGANVRALEQEVAAFMGAGHEVGVASGTDALRLCLDALDVKSGDEVTTTPFIFDALLADTSVVVPAVAEGATHVYHQYTIRAPRRDALADHLRRQGIGTMVYYPRPLHRQAICADLGYAEGSLPESERAGREVISLPIYPELTDAQIEAVGAAIHEFYRSSSHP